MLEVKSLIKIHFQLQKQLEAQEKVSKDLQKELEDEKKKQSKELKVALNNLKMIKGDHEDALFVRVRIPDLLKL